MNNRRGVTLVEILLAIIVMAVGMMGIMAIYPATLQTGKTSMEETNAAILSNSIKQALSMALKRATWDNAKQRYVMVLTHDMKNGNAGNVVSLDLPNTTEGWWHYPGTTALTNGSVETMSVYALGADPWVWAALKEVWDKNDPTDPYDQFAFSFDVRKVNNISWMNPQPIDLEQRVRLFDFRVHVLRRRNNAQVMSGEGNGTMMLAAPDEYELVTTVTFGGSAR
jgi:prepilin-type N-terminal cleavage/methylation domain-containing protein